MGQSQQDAEVKIGVTQATLCLLKHEKMYGQSHYYHLNSPLVEVKAEGLLYFDHGMITLGEKRVLLTSNHPWTSCT